MMWHVRSGAAVPLPPHSPPGPSRLIVPTKFPDPFAIIIGSLLVSSHTTRMRATSDMRIVASILLLQQYL